MPRQPVDSTALEFVDYDARSEELDIGLTTGRTYRYFDVPPDVYEALMAADSKGRFYNDHIRDVYVCERLR
ncbi:MAG TPA: KTSC domain-containing protein [Dongiaceae bacterium]